MSITGDTTERFASALANRYRVERVLGSGGMATVYLAQDLKHERRVALKVLKPELAAIIGAQRFLAEIRTTANLQHPHILSLFDSGEAQLEGAADVVGGRSVFYVMPFVEGESLRDRLTREGQLPIVDAVRITREVAEALAYAHTHGVIHRDIKPENILLQGGHALVADFGIALAVSRTGGHRLTESGMSLGTPTYMSPEQAMGERNLDARTDIYALGCVLYEMLAGEPPFTGPTAQAIVARVMTEEPRSLVAQRRTIPEHVAAAVETAIAKLPADRFASAADFSAALEGTLPTSTPKPFAGAVLRTPARVRRAMAGLAGALLLAVGVAAWGWLRPRPEPPVTRTYLRFPEPEAPLLGRTSYTLLPDGSGLVYVGKAADGRTQLWMKKRSELHATQLGGTVGATNVFVSPDGAWLAFIADGKLKKMPVTGGEPTVLAPARCTNLGCPDGVARGGAWLDDGRIAFVAGDEMSIMASSGGAVEVLLTNAASGGLAPLLPVALPNSRGLLFTACTLYCNKANVMAVDLRTKQVTTLVEDALLPQYTSTGLLVYVKAGGTAFAVPFDVASLKLEGTPTPVMSDVAGELAISRNGTLAYAEGTMSPRSELVLISRDGRGRESVDSTWRGNFATLDVSPDGRRIAASVVGGGNEHLWIKTIGGGPPMALTYGNSQSTTPTWTADGTSVLYTRFDGTRSATFASKRADGTGPETVIYNGENWVIESETSRDGTWLVQRDYRNGARDIYARRLTGDTTMLPVVTSSGEDFSPSLSPDARWLVYASRETDHSEVWVVPFPNPQGAKWRISTDGGVEPMWSPDGREIFYVNPKNELVAVEVSTSGTFSSGRQRALFDVSPYRRHLSHRAYDVLPDGRFLMIHDVPPEPGNLVMVDNWFVELASRVK